MNKICLVITILYISLFFLGCSKSESKNQLKVVASAVPHAEMLEYIQPDLQSQGIDLQVIVSDDYNMPNRALAEKEVDANFFQHLPYLEEQVKEFNYPIVSLAKIEIEPMGIYSRKITSLSDLKEGALIAIPNDPTNEARGLLLLEEHGLIGLNKKNNLKATPQDITSNPKKLRFIEVDAGMLPRSLEDVDAAAINTNYAMQADLSPLQDALVLEDKNSPYINILAVRKGEENREDIKTLKSAMTSEKMRAFLLKKYKGAVLPAF